MEILILYLQIYVEYLLHSSIFKEQKSAFNVFNVY